MQLLDEAVALRASDPGRAVLDALQLQEQFERLLIGPAAVFPAVVREQSFDAQALLLAPRQAGLGGLQPTLAYARNESTKNASTAASSLVCYPSI